MVSKDPPTLAFLGFLKVWLETSWKVKERKRGRKGKIFCLVEEKFKEKIKMQRIVFS